MTIKSLIAVCLFAVIAFFGSLMYVSPPTPVVAQGNVLENRVKALETAQAALLKRVSALEAAAPSATVTATVSSKDKKDELGIPYQNLKIDSGIEVAGWEAYQDHNDYWSVAGNILNKSTSERFSVVDFKIRFYKGQRLIQVAAISVGGRWVDPGQSLPFEFSSSVKPSEFDRYTIEASAGDWVKTP